MAEFAAPPSYDDLVSPGPEGSLQPTAPPLADIVGGGGDEPDAPRPYYNAPPTSDERRRSAPAPQSAQSGGGGFIERYITYSMARRLRKYIEPKSDQQDPELDVEAQFGRTAVRSAQHAIQKKHRLQCISGWLWCIAVMLAFVYIALPVAMIIVGAIGVGGNCPFRNHTIIIYLIGGGIVLAITVILRGFPSILTCMRNRNYCSMRDSSSSGECICATEILFYIAMFINFITLILGLYTTFAESKPPSCYLSPGSAPDCCDAFVYVSCATFTVLQCVLYAFSGLFVCLVVCCIRSMDKEMKA